MASTVIPDDALDQFLRLTSMPLAGADVLSKGHLSDSKVEGIPDYSVVEYGRNEIRKALEWPDRTGLSVSALFGMIFSMRIAAVLGRASQEQYALYCEITDALRKADWVAPLDEHAPWTTAISAAKYLRANANYDVHSLNTFTRQHAVAEAAKRLERSGCKISINARGVSIAPDDYEAMCQQIDDAVCRLGGRGVTANILRSLIGTGRTYEGTVLYGRKTSQLPEYRLPSIPWHYLYNLALKHLDKPGASEASQSDWKLLTDLSRDLGAMFDAEAYGAFENLDINPTKVHDIFVENTVYDELFAFQQWQPNVSEDLISSWLRGLLAEGVVLPGGTIEQWDRLCRSLIKLSETGSLKVTVAAEHTAHGIMTSGQSLVMMKALSIPIQKINAEYKTPLDTKARNSPYYPLYEITEGLFLLPPRGLLARALYERLYALMREADGNNKWKAGNREKAMGGALERVSADAIRQSGQEPSIIGGRYEDPDTRQKYDVDLAIETDHRIFLVECKKKPLTNMARSGNALSAISDVAASFLAMMVQMSRHELVLRKHGKIVFNDGSILSRNGREIERIAVTLSDHGSLQDRIFLSSLVRGLYGSKLTATDPVNQKSLDDVNKAARVLSDNIRELASLTGEDLDRYLRMHTIGTWWLSVDQLWFICSESSDLGEGLKSLRHITCRTGDIMTEISNLNQMQMLKWNKSARQVA